MIQGKLGHLCLLVGSLGGLFTLTFAYGFEFKIDGPEKASYFGAWSVLFTLCFALSGWGIIRIHRRAESYTPPASLAPLLTTVSFLTTLYFWFPSRVALIAAIPTLGIVALLLHRRQHWPCLSALLAANCVLAVTLMLLNPIDIRAADMLPVIIDANLSMLNGDDPYTPRDDGRIFMYLPVQWLVYLPFVLGAVDVRIGNLLCLVAFSGSIMWMVRHNRMSPLVLVVLGPLLVSRTSIGMIIAGQVWPYWLLVLALVATLLSYGRRECAVVLGLLVATQQPATLLAVLLGAYLVFHGRFKTALWVAVGAGATFAVMMAPWVIIRPSLLFELYIGIHQIVAEKHLANPAAYWLEVSLMNLLQAAGMGSWRSIAQFAVMLGAGLSIVLMRNLRLGTFVCICGLAYLLAISLNGLIAKYYYYPGLILLGLGIAVPSSRLAPFASLAPSAPSRATNPPALPSDSHR